MRFEQLAHRKPRSIPAGGGRLFRFANSHFAGKRIIRHLGMDCRGEWNGRYFLRPGGWPDRADRHTTVVHRDDELHQVHHPARFGFCEQRRNDLVYIVERTSVDQYR